VTAHYFSHQEQVRNPKNLAFVDLHFAESRTMSGDPPKGGYRTYFESHQANNNAKSKEDDGNDQPQDAPDYNGVSACIPFVHKNRTLRRTTAALLREHGRIRRVHFPLYRVICFNSSAMYSNLNEGNHL
jgi:hypothetical protein